ncbi:protein of unknown function [Acidithiobacillus ferrivorans]|uniref:Uncharacterized protein n=1 Tax=Acidithiobacillus ferrivorans TaxID=160808 RepID=A0A060URZ4_9PROT|nr:hypothetical protein AFERRI_50031 [Acidithiobacillus ferrivorans]SMH65001.1 protein of unknown function [Acidithiobacillus ferrivorans]
MLFSLHLSHLHVDHRVILAICIYNAFRDANLIVLIAYCGSYFVIS